MSPDTHVFSPGSTTPSRKRKNSEDHHDATTTPANNNTASSTTASGARRYRASRACQYCRTRKVRCDVLRTEADCTNCRLDNRECILLESRRGKPEQWRNYGQETVRRGPAKPHALPVSQPISQVHNMTTGSAREDSILAVDNGSRERTADASVTGDAPGGDVPICVTFEGNDADEDGEHDEETDEGEDTARQGDGIDGDHHDAADTHSASAYTPSESLDALAFVFRDSSTAVATGSVSAPGSHAAATPSNNTTNSPSMLPPYSPPPPLPSFIAPFRNKIPADDRAFLARKGALTVPDFDLRVAILRGYIFSVHPFMPMLDIKPFVQAVLSSDEEPLPSERRISLLLFQAVMFAGLSSLEPHYLHRLGFATAKQAREVFFVRVKLLYELDVEPDSAAVFQSLLLMSSWYSKWNSWKDTSHWTAQALLVAQNMGLHREPTAACGPLATQKRRRRMWWSLYIRDRMIALGTRRPMRIRDGDYDVAMLSVEDFEYGDNDGDNDGEFDGEFDDLGLLLSKTDNEDTARLCVELAKLCVLIARVLTTQYTTLSTQPAVPHNTMVVPRRARPHGHERDRNREEIQQCDAAIAQWQKNLALHLNLKDGILQTSSPCIDFHWGMLNLAHLTLVNVLHRTQAMPPSPDAVSTQADESPEERAVRKASRAKVKDAACKVTKIAQSMLQRGQVRFLGLNGITAMLAACLSHMVDIRGASVSAGGAEDNDDVRDASIFRFSQNMQVLYAMTSMFATADASVSFLASVVKKVQLPIPTAATPTTTTPTASVNSLSNVIPPPPSKKPSASHRSMSMSAVPTQQKPVITGGSTNFAFGSTPWTPSQQLTGLGDVTVGWDSVANSKTFGSGGSSSTMQSQSRLATAVTHLSPSQTQSLGLGMQRSVQGHSHGMPDPMQAGFDTAMKDVDGLHTSATSRSTGAGFSSYNDIVLDSLFPPASTDLEMYSYDFFLDNFDLPECQPQGME
ncbi:hypothetical protein SBRCBS47491_009405 [Sporothrix bragantina]|uniref:Zn(2)-C6 fungal-type domain-containing protein n=1 Tax=Sporothrix bragantina TaxID=671064 RepID=A0ABP0CXM5_9PEZI